MADYWGPFLQGLSYLESNNNPNEGNPMQNGRPMSSARGAFQYINGTAQQAMNAGLPDPRQGDLNQQSAVTQSFIRKFLPKGAAAIDNGDYATAFRELRSTWPSLPGGSQQQNPERYQQFQKILGGNVDMPIDYSSAPLPGLDPNIQQQLLRQIGGAQQPYNPMTSDWGSALQSAGAALAAASNPQAAYALTSLANQNRNDRTEQQKALQSGLLRMAEMRQQSELKKYEVQNENARQRMGFGHEDTTLESKQAHEDKLQQLRQIHEDEMQGKRLTSEQENLKTRLEADSTLQRDLQTQRLQEPKFFKMEDNSVQKWDPVKQTMEPAFNGPHPIKATTEQNLLGERVTKLYDSFTGKSMGYAEGENPSISDEQFQKILEAKQAGPKEGETPDQFEQRLIDMAPTALRGLIRDRINGTANPAGYGAGSRVGTAANLFARTIANVDDTEYQNRARFWNPNGNIQQNLISNRTAIEHAHQASDLVEALKNPSDVHAINAAVNTIRSSFNGDPKITNAQTALQAVANEFGKTVHGAGAMAEEAVKKWSQGLNTSLATRQLQGTLDTMINDLATARKNSVEEYYRQAFHKEPPNLLGNRYLDMQSDIHKRATEAANPQKTAPKGAPDINTFFQ